MLSNTLRLSFYYLKIINIFHPSYHTRIMGQILKKANNKCVCVHEIIHNENEDENEKKNTYMEHQ